MDFLDMSINTFIDYSSFARVSSRDFDLLGAFVDVAVFLANTLRFCILSLMTCFILEVAGPEGVIFREEL